MKKSNIITSLICAVAVSAVSVFSTLAVTNANNEVTFNSQGRIVYEAPDGDSAKNVVFDANDFSTISNLVTDGKIGIANSINTYSNDAANPIISTIDANGNPYIPTFQELTDAITGMTQLDKSKFKERTATSETLGYGTSRTYEAGYYPNSWTVTGKNPTGTKTITSNGTYDIKDYSSVSVSVNSSSSPGTDGYTMKTISGTNSVTMTDDGIAVFVITAKCAGGNSDQTGGAAYCCVDPYINDVLQKHIKTNNLGGNIVTITYGNNVKSGDVISVKTSKMTDDTWLSSWNITKVVAYVACGA